MENENVYKLEQFNEQVAKKAFLMQESQRAAFYLSQIPDNPPEQKKISKKSIKVRASSRKKQSIVYNFAELDALENEETIPV